MGFLGPVHFVLELVLLLACAGAYYRAADLENESGLLWAALSVLVFISTWFVLGWSYMGNLLGQGLLLIGIAIVRAVRDSRKRP